MIQGSYVFFAITADRIQKLKWEQDESDKKWIPINNQSWCFFPVKNSKLVHVVTEMEKILEPLRISHGGKNKLDKRNVPYKMSDVTSKGRGLE